MSIRHAIEGLRSEWRPMTLYERFEQLVALVLVLTIAMLALGGVAAFGAAP